MVVQKNYLATTFICLNSLLGIFPLLASAQIIPDETLGVERSLVSPSSEGDLISGGATRGSNLFHSFERFDVSSGQSAYFVGADSLERIFARVTGSSPSLILGRLGVLSLGTDLIFINSNGIIFGPDSNLDLTGSFLGTTADSIQFQDGRTLMTRDTAVPVLTSSIPSGLGLGETGTISVQNAGHDYSISPFSPIQESNPRLGLSVPTGQAFALVGGGISFDGGIVRANGRIELASVAEGNVSFNPSDWSLDLSSVSRYGDITLSNLSLLETNGVFSGSISLTGRDINLEDGSFIFSQSIIGSSLDSISLSASNSVNLSGGNPIQGVTSTILSRQVGPEKGSSILISAPAFTLIEGNRLLTDTVSSGDAGDITLDIANTAEIGGFDPIDNSFLSTIATGTFGAGNAGNVQLSTNRLRLFAGGSVGSSTYSSGNGGSVVIDSNEIVVEGAVPTNFSPSTISSASYSLGNAGRIEINTGSLQVLNGGRVSASTISAGNADRVAIRATRSVEVSGTFPGARNPSMIDSSGNLLDPSLAEILQLQYPLVGNAGSVDISSPRLTVQNGGLVTVQNEGVGDAGTLTVSSESLRLGARGAISASTNGGNGGNIDLAAENLLVGVDSNITASSRGEGLGGNIFIESDAIALFPNSSITANADQGAGGRVEISTDALLRSPNSVITATSAVGPELDGTVDIQSPNETISTETEAVPQAIGVLEISAACVSNSAESSEFVVTGRGGLPRSPTSIQQNYSGWRSPSTPSSAIELNRAPQITEAQGWVPNGDGTVNFTDQPANPVYASAQNTACVSGAAQNPS